MKYYISQEAGSVYWLEGNCIMFAPLSLRGDTFNTNSGGEVDEQLMQGELLANGREFSELYAEIRKLLTK